MPLPASSNDHGERPNHHLNPKIRILWYRRVYDETGFEKSSRDHPYHMQPRTHAILKSLSFWEVAGDCEFRLIHGVNYDAARCRGTDQSSFGRGLALGTFEVIHFAVTVLRYIM